MTNEERAKLVEQLRDEDSYYRIQESHWCIDSEELERQRQQAAAQIEADGQRIAELEAALRLVIENEDSDTGYGNSSAKIARAALAKRGYEIREKAGE